MGRRPRRSPSGGRRRCGRRASCDITIIPRIRTGLRRSSRMRSGREAWRSGSAAVIKAATGCLRHTLARTAERRAVQQPDYPAAAGDLQELASVTVCARQPRRAALRPSRPTHSQAARAMSLPGTTRTSQRACRMSASGSKAENIYSSRVFPSLTRLGPGDAPRFFIQLETGRLPGVRPTRFFE